MTRKETFDAILLVQKKYAKTFNTLPQKSTLYSNTINMLNFSICRATGMEEDPEVTLDIHCLQLGGGAALTSTNNYFLHQRGSGGARAIMV